MSRSTTLDRICLICEESGSSVLAQAAARQELVEKTLPLWLGHFERLLVKNSRTPLFPGFAVGSKISLAVRCARSM